MTDENIKEVIMTDGNKCIVKQTDTLMAKKVAEICQDYTSDSALAENEVRIACYRVSTEIKSKIEVLEEVLKDIRKEFPQNDRFLQGRGHENFIICDSLEARILELKEGQ